MCKRSASSNSLILALGLLLLSCGGRTSDLEVPGAEGKAAETIRERQAISGYLALPGVQGPDSPSPKPRARPAEWRTYSGGSASRLAILLTDPRSTWLGLVHGFKSFGIPFTITDSMEEALEHGVVLLYPSPRTLGAEALRDLRYFVDRGGTLLAAAPNPRDRGSAELFGYDRAKRSKNHWELEYQDSPWSAGFVYPEERSIRMNSPDRKKNRIAMTSFSGAQEVLARYGDGSAAILRRASGAGQAIAFGWDLGRYIQRSQNNRDDEANRSYVNDFEPSVDTVLRFLAEFYRRAEPNAVTIHPAPDGWPLSVVISHDVDYAGSLANSVIYAEYERSRGYGATYYLQTKYFQDYFDKMFFDEKTSGLMARLEELGMELASHSVCHSDMFARLPMGTFKEAYPAYQPRIMEYFYTRRATIMGELRVSKYLIEQGSRSRVVSFRPGFLANPFALSEALESAGYRYSSAVTADDVMTHLPFRLNYDRLYAAETGIYEFPITVEDEKDPPMDGRIDAAVALAEKLSRYGGLYMVLIHPNVTGEKLRFLEGLSERLRDKAWWGTLKEFGDWWSARDQVEADILLRDGQTVLRLTAEGPVQGLALRLPKGYAAGTPSAAVRTSGPFTVLDLSGGTTELPLVRDR